MPLSSSRGSEDPAFRSGRRTPAPRWTARHRAQRGSIKGFGLAGLIALLVGAGSAIAFQPLPRGQQVNDDLTAGINKAISVAGEDPTNSDVVGGSLVAVKPAVPWATSRRREPSGTPAPPAPRLSPPLVDRVWA